MNWGFITILILFAMTLGISMERHGKPRHNENAWVTFLSIAMYLTLILWAMHWSVN